MNRTGRKAFLIILILLACMSAVFSADYQYHYSLLNKSEKELYTRILDAVSRQSPEIQDVGNSDPMIEKVFQYVLLDNPELFYVSTSYSFITNTRNNVPFRYDLRFNYEDPDTAASRSREVVNAIRTLLDSIKNPQSIYDIVKGVYEYLARNVTYDERYSDQSLYSVLVRKRGVCAGFAKAFNYIMNLAEIPCITVTGYLDGARHSWNMVQLDGRWYHVDATSAVSARDQGDVFYSFLCIPYSQISRTHQAESTIKLPAASATDLEYFTLNGRMMEKWSLSSYEKMLKAAAKQKLSALTVKFGSQSELEKAQTTLFSDSKIFQLLKDNNITKNKISYTVNEEFLILSIEL